MVRHIMLCTCLLIAAQGIATADLVENFDSIASATSDGWALVNNSAPPGTTGWFQGNSAIFAAQSGAPDSYIAANYLNADSGGDVSNWLISPEISLATPLFIKFYTRTETPAVFADRLELRLSTNGASTNVGTSAASVGDFSTLLLTVNPALSPSGYPDSWTQLSAVLPGYGPGTEGRIALRYFVTDTNTNGDYIGIDSLTVTTPEPATIVCLATVLAALALRRKTR